MDSNYINSYMEVSEPKWANSDCVQYRVNSYRLVGQQLLNIKVYKRLKVFDRDSEYQVKN